MLQIESAPLTQTQCHQSSHMAHLSRAPRPRLGVGRRRVGLVLVLVHVLIATLMLVVLRILTTRGILKTQPVKYVGIRFPLSRAFATKTAEHRSSIARMVSSTMPAHFGWEPDLGYI